jgi:hypothetical protein
MEYRFAMLFLMLCAAPHLLRAQASSAPAPAVPEWAQPGSPTHVQVPPPADFHRPSRNFDTPIGVFQGQSDIGGAVVPGSASYDPGTKQYTINSAGYNIWYSRDPDFLQRGPRQGQRCAAFFTESRMQFAGATKLHRKSGG